LREVPPYIPEGKAVLVKKLWDNNCVYHSLMICDIPPKNIGITVDVLLEYTNALTGANFTMDDMYELVERTETIARLFNIREGFSLKDDTLPWRILNEPLPDGPPKGVYVKQSDLDLMLDDYYALRGWDKNGVPLPETVKRLGLEGGRVIDEDVC
jgi:aldehyde:ferredoxin oxidoreductase